MQSTQTFEDQGLLTREKLGLFIVTAARRWPDREFALFNGRRYSYDEVRRWTEHVALRLLEHGVRPCDRLLAQLPNSIELAVLQFAIWRIGAIAAPVIPVYRQHELRHIIGDCAPRAFASVAALGGRRLCDELDELVREGSEPPALRWAIGEGDAPPGWEAFPALPDQPIDATALPAPPPSSGTALILYTSGTTAAPKGVNLTGAGIISHTANLARTLGLTERDVFVAGSPIAHVAGMSMGVLMPAGLGARTLILPSWNADAALALIQEEKATFMSSAPVFLADIVARYEKADATTHRLHRYMAGGATVPPNLIARADAVGIKASRIYGMTETGGTCSVARAEDPLERRASTDGRVLFGTEIEIVDTGRKPLPYGEIGEVRLRSPQLMSGYSDPEANARQFDSEGWFYPGDAGRIDAEGWFTMTGRTKDIINRGGEKFSAQDIEQALGGAPGVAMAAVVGAPDDRFGEVVAAFLVLRDDAVWDGPAKILEHLEQVKLAKQKMPVQWRVLPALPTTATGKVQKQKLLDMIAADGER